MREEYAKGCQEPFAEVCQLTRETVEREQKEADPKQSISHALPTPDVLSKAACHLHLDHVT